MRANHVRGIRRRGLSEQSDSGALARGNAKITAISNNCGTHEGELGLIFKNRQVRSVICSFPGPHSTYFQEQLAAREVTLELVPQGILCERMRAAAAGLVRFLHHRGSWHGSRGG